MTTTIPGLRIGPDRPDRWWSAFPAPEGDCQDCGGQCDGAECGLHAAGCIFGGPNWGAYWLIADGCPLWHGEDA